MVYFLYFLDVGAILNDESDRIGLSFLNNRSSIILIISCSIFPFGYDIHPEHVVLLIGMTSRVLITSPLVIWLDWWHVMWTFEQRYDGEYVQSSYHKKMDEFYSGWSWWSSIQFTENQMSSLYTNITRENINQVLPLVFSNISVTFSWEPV